jgi:ABC-type transport system involved in multi-copper enzyme maturation permease subunit
MKSVTKLICRDLRRAFGLRTLGIWVVMALFTIYFFFFSNGRRELVENNRLEYMSLFLPLIIFGAWAVMAVFFDLISADRERNVLDCILCSGTTKKHVFIAKIIATAIVSLALSFIYLAPIVIIVACLSSAQKAAMIGRYLLPLWGFIMVFAALGLMISVFARSSKMAMIWSLASGLVLMPRFFVLIPEGIGKVLNLSTQTVEKISMISPGIMMEALSNPNNTSSWTTAVVGFTIGIVVLFGIAYIAFKNQDEYNYGE